MIRCARALGAVLVLAVLLTGHALAAQVKIAVIDSGIATAPFLPTQLESGKNYRNPTADTADHIGHGTAIAGILIGSAAAGVRGVCEDAVVVPLVVATQNEQGEQIMVPLAVIAQAVRDAVDIYGCRVINISAGSTVQEPALAEAVQYAEAQGAVVVASVGNEGGTDVYYPAAYPTVLGVGALRADGVQVSGFSQRGAFVSLCAPGDRLRVVSVRGKTISATGTSYAAAYVSGGAARLLAENPMLTPAQVRRILCGAAAEIATPGWDKASGWGALRIDEALLWAAQGRRFRDVEADSPYVDAVRLGADSGIVSGVSETMFAPDAPLTRAMLWTVLARLEGTPTPPGELWYGAAQHWAVESGLTDGSAPENAVTREQLAVTLARYAQARPTQTQALAVFSDGQQVSPWAQPAMAWAVEQGLFVGENGKLAPQTVATRGEVIALTLRMKAEKTPSN